MIEAAISSLSITNTPNYISVWCHIFKVNDITALSALALSYTQGIT